MIDGWRRLWRSIGFRLAFQVGLLVTITLVATLSIVYMQTVGVLHQRMARQVETTSQQLLARFAEGGTPAVAAEIQRTLGDGRDSDSEILLLTDAHGQVLAGNLDELPQELPPTTDPVRWPVLRGARIVSGYLVARTLDDGAQLVIGSDLREQEDLESLVLQASGAAAVVAVLLLIGGTFVFRQELERSIGTLRQTAARIAAGQVQERVPIGEDEDEFALLARDINAMLDRIESLMDGVRHVSNTIAHNLRTPLMRVLTRLHAADDAGASPAARQAAIAAARTEVQELATVFEKLLRIAEAESGAQRRQFAPVSLARMADDMLELYDAAAEAQGVRLVRDPDDPADVLGDGNLLAGALANLLDNALKYAGRGATVRVGTEVLRGQALLTVRDDGPGVPAAELSRLGQRFHRLDPAMPGHGLGLASVQAVLALHAGRLVLVDAAPGLEARIALPVHVPT